MLKNIVLVMILINKTQIYCFDIYRKGKRSQYVFEESKQCNRLWIWFSKDHLRLFNKFCWYGGEVYGTLWILHVWDNVNHTILLFFFGSSSSSIDWLVYKHNDQRYGNIYHVLSNFENIPNRFDVPRQRTKIRNSKKWTHIILTIVLLFRNRSYSIENYLGHLQRRTHIRLRYMLLSDWYTSL